LEGSDGVLAWLLRRELIGRMEVVELDLEDKTGVAEE